MMGDERLLLALYEGKGECGWGVLGESPDRPPKSLPVDNPWPKSRSELPEERYELSERPPRSNPLPPCWSRLSRESLRSYVIKRRNKTFWLDLANM